MDSLLGRCFARCAGDTGAVVNRASSYHSAVAAVSAASNSSNRSGMIYSRRGNSSVQVFRPHLVNTTKLSSSAIGVPSWPLGGSGHLRTPFLANFSAAASSASAASPIRVDDDLVDKNDFGTAGPSGTARVRFLLQKECLFGQQFAIVGDQPCMGLWDPSDAVPLEWSDGHIWKAELDLPVDKQIQFKFILRGSSGKITWQPGPDRVLQTWEAQNTIVVTEDWENADDQKITTEETLEEAAVRIVENIDNSLGSINEPSLVILETAQEARESTFDAEFPQKIHSEEKLEGSNQERDVILIPGLTPTSIAVAAQNIVDASSGIRTEEEPNNRNFVQLSPEEERTETPSPKLLEVNIALSQTSAYASELTPDSDDAIAKDETGRKQYDCQSKDDGVGENWGRRTLAQLLLNLGFITKSTEAA